VNDSNKKMEYLKQSQAVCFILVGFTFALLLFHSSDGKTGKEVGLFKF